MPIDPPDDFEISFIIFEKLHSGLEFFLVLFFDRVFWPILPLSTENSGLYCLFQQKILACIAFLYHYDKKNPKIV